MSAKNYEAGDKAIVRGDLRPHEWYGGVFFASQMAIMAGRIITIERVYDDCYISAGWEWTDEMLMNYLPVADNDTEFRTESEDFSISITVDELSDLYKRRGCI